MTELNFKPGKKLLKATRLLESVFVSTHQILSRSDLDEREPILLEVYFTDRGFADLDLARRLVRALAEHQSGPERVEEYLKHTHYEFGRETTSARCALESLGDDLWNPAPEFDAEKTLLEATKVFSSLRSSIHRIFARLPFGSRDFVPLEAYFAGRGDRDFIRARDLVYNLAKQQVGEDALLEYLGETDHIFKDHPLAMQYPFAETTDHYGYLRPHKSTTPG